jgi:hypothetical protein
MESSDEDGRLNTGLRGGCLLKDFMIHVRELRGLHAVIYDAHKSAGRRHDI